MFSKYMPRVDVCICVCVFYQNVQRIGSGQTVRTDVSVWTVLSVTDRRGGVFVSRAGRDSTVRMVRSSTDVCWTQEHSVM